MTLAFVAGLVFGFVFTGAGVIVGHVINERKHTRVEPPDFTPICMCNHNYSTHKNGGKCSALISKNYIDYNCACYQYVGPDPALSGLYVAPFIPEPPKVKKEKSTQ